MPEDDERRGWPDEERRTGDAPDAGVRRRRTDTLTHDVRAIQRAMQTHETEAREWRARHDARLQAVEDRADLLDGQAGNDGGLLQIVGELKGELRGVHRELANARDDLRDLKAKTGAVDGQKPETRLQKGIAIAVPILIATLPVVGTIVAAWLALKGQLANVGGR